MRVSEAEAVATLTDMTTKSQRHHTTVALAAYHDAARVHDAL